MEHVTLLNHFLNNSTPCYGGKSAVNFQQLANTRNEITCHSQIWTLENHVGTHIDLPKHFDGAGKTMEMYGANDWIFCHPYLLDLNLKSNSIIGVTQEFDLIPKNTDFLIIRTGFEKFRNQRDYWENNPGFDPSVADWLRENLPSIRVVGFDTISLTGFQNRDLGRLAHREFLYKTPSICLIEDMKISHLKRNPSKIIVAPLFVEGADGGPVTIFSFETF